MSEFLDEENTRVLMILGDSLEIATAMPSKIPSKGRVIYWLKRQAGVVRIDAVQQQLLLGELSQEPLKHLQQIVNDVYTPLLSHPANQVGWGDVAVKNVMEWMHVFLANVSIMLGQTEGKTCLPLPPMENGAGIASASTNKDRIHLLESAVITWTKQIKNVLKQDPETMLKQGLNPTPDAEIAFWAAKAANLNSIFIQLQGPNIRKVLRFLDQFKSTYCTPFAKLCSDVFKARLEANDNVKFLSTLDSTFLCGATRAQNGRALSVVFVVVVFPRPSSAFRNLGWLHATATGQCYTKLPTRTRS